jgi:hypothetical protein
MSYRCSTTCLTHPHALGTNRPFKRLGDTQFPCVHGCYVLENTLRHLPNVVRCLCVCQSVLFSLWQNTWQKQLKERKFYFVHSFWGFSLSWWRGCIAVSYILVNGRRLESQQEGATANYSLQGHTTSNLPASSSHLPRFHHLLIVYSNYESVSGLNHSLRQISHNLIVSRNALIDMFRGMLH